MNEENNHNDKLAKSQQQADLIAEINTRIFMLDTEHLTEAVRDMRSQASRQESIAVLNPTHPQEANDLLRKQAETLQHLLDYKQGIFDCSKIKIKIQCRRGEQDEINKLFL